MRRSPRSSRLPCGRLEKLAAHLPASFEGGSVTSTASVSGDVDRAQQSFLPQRLKAAVQQYDWGLNADASLVASLGARNCGLFDASQLVGDESLPFAELWLGTHPSGPALIAGGDGQPLPLADYIRAHRELGGDCIAEHSGTAKTGGVDGGLPFLLKILSVNTALSIQAHPDRTLAAKLYAERSDVYKDPNHKPELICALEPFVGMCGFRKASEIAGFLTSVPELRALVGEAAAGAYLDRSSIEPEDALESLFGTLMRSEPEPVVDRLEALATRLASAGVTAECGAAADRMALYLLDQYPGDIGVWCVYFLNIAELEPGQALYLGANLPHAYVKGQGVEIMACSDNVVRAGLTPKLRDVDTLCTMLDYSGGSADVLDGSPVDEHVRCYAGPADDFKLFRIDLSSGCRTELPPSPGPQIILGICGEAKTNGVTSISEGSAHFVPAGQALAFENSESGLAGAPAQIFVACCNDGFF